jgi:hypothetical protein
MSALSATEVRILLNRGDSASTAPILAAAAELGPTGQLSSGSKDSRHVHMRATSGGVRGRATRLRYLQSGPARRDAEKRASIDAAAGQ